MIRALKLHPPTFHILHLALSSCPSSLCFGLRHTSSPSTCSLFPASSFILFHSASRPAWVAYPPHFTPAFFLLTSLATRSAISPLLKGRLCYLPEMQQRSKASPSGRESKKRQGERWGGIRDQTRLYNDPETGYVISLSVSFLSL